MISIGRVDWIVAHLLLALGRCATADEDRDVSVFSLSPPSILSAFAIDPVSGNISVVVPLNWVVQSFYTFTVVVTERSRVPPLNATQDVYLFVEKINYPPIVTSPAIMFLRERQPNGTVAYNLTVTHPYDPLDTDLFAIVGGTFAPYFKIGNTSGVIVTAFRFDYHTFANRGTLIVSVRLEVPCAVQRIVPVSSNNCHNPMCQWSLLLLFPWHRSRTFPSFRRCIL